MFKFYFTNILAHILPTIELYENTLFLGTNKMLNRNKLNFFFLDFAHLTEMFEGKMLKLVICFYPSVVMHEIMSFPVPTLFFCLSF